jgi:ribose-phosphate pyrophosphokinase
MHGNLRIFAASSHPSLAQNIAGHLGMEISPSEVVRFANENLMIKIHENVRECDVFVVQTSSPPVSDGIIELLIMIDALRSASAARITAVMPYFPYCRSDKKDRPRISIAARLMADLLQTAGADRVLTMDLHSPQIQGFFRIPCDNLQAAPIICDYFKNRDLSEYILVAADAGEAKELGRYANRLHLPFAIIDKRRYGDDDRAHAQNLIGEVEGKHCLIVDDEIATGGTLIEATNFLVLQGALSVRATATHPVLAGPAMDRIRESPLCEVVVCDSIPVRHKLEDPILKEKIKVLPLAEFFSKAIRRIHDGNSVSDLFR